MDEDEKSQYEEKLLELVERGADRNIIALLTEIAEEHAKLSESNAADIVKIIEKRIKEVITDLVLFCVVFLHNGFRLLRNTNYMFSMLWIQF